MRKIFIAALLMVASFIGSQILSANVCSAIPDREICLGGVGTWGSYPVDNLAGTGSAVRDIYGEPTRIERNVWRYDDDTYGDIWRYGDSVEIYFVKMSFSAEEEIAAVKVTADNGWKTPSGLAVGMSIEDALRMYEDINPDHVKIFGDKCVIFTGGYMVPDNVFGIVFDRNSHKILKLCICIYGHFRYGNRVLAEDMVQWMSE